MFAHSVADAVEVCRIDPGGSELNPSWQHLMQRYPEVAEMLVEALNPDASDQPPDGTSLWPSLSN